MLSGRVRAATWGLVNAGALAGLIVAGSRRLDHFDAALVGYTFATLFACRITPGTGAVEYVDAGHGLTLIVPPEGPARRLESTDLPLGALPDDTWVARAERLDPGETLLLVSDGVLDIYSEEETVVAVATDLVREVQQPAEMIRRIEHYARTNELADDLTAVAIRRLPS